MKGSDHFPLETQMTHVVKRVKKSVKANLMRVLLGDFLGTVDFTLMGRIAFGLCMGAIIGRSTEG